MQIKDLTEKNVWTIPLLNLVSRQQQNFNVSHHCPMLPLPVLPVTISGKLLKFLSL